MAAKQLWFTHIDWMINWMGFSFLALLIGLIYADVQSPKFVEWTSNPFSAWNFIGSAGIPVVYVLMAIGCTLSMVIAQPRDKKAYDWKKFLVGFTLVWGFTMLSKWLAAQKNVKSAKLGDSIWAIFFGCSLYHIVKRLNKQLLHCLDLAKQTELYIATSLVLLVINYSDLKTIIGNSVFVAWIDTPILFVLFSYIGVTVFKLRPKQSMILTGCTVICGSSAATAIRNSLKGKEKDQKDAILISSLLTIPCIAILPIIAQSAGFSDDISGAWFGGSVDSTGAVLATSNQYGSGSAASSAVVKMVQNILIAPISVFVVAFYIKYQDRIDEVELKRTRVKSRTASQQGEAQRAQRLESKKGRTSRQPSRNQEDVSNNLADRKVSINDCKENREERSVSKREGRINSKREGRINSKRNDIEQPLVEKPKQISYLGLIWERFPKFVLGFIVSILVFNLAVVSDKQKEGKDFIFCVSEWFSTCSFVSIGMSLQLAKGDGRELMILSGIYLIIQMVDILTTLGYAYISFTYF
ncbi:membrane protein, putative (macronuclear) [Tetrahymena thermophila SB210]|uniref:Membrane protein, putative n=1 Tax=Tetrahymena thermophila (strain SB210) TaxID=312017 RepID=I7MAB9_TETTS|nr:membrane protein, putative [Tetrahymena thermophila SB210]EAS04291.1 membrane protein, putative [Tetrahymena thermophila SB210]|eukprot:XP_001024536.1 membrane protein, putative [Tetrahymena thermophila SB210]